MKSSRNSQPVVSRAKTGRRLPPAILAGAVVFVAGVSFSALAAAAAVDSPTTPAVKKLVHEFDLVPNLLSAAKGKAEGDPLQTITRRMTVIHSDLSQFETDEPVQTRERQVVKSLDEMIAILQQHCNGLGRGNKPNGGRKDSIIVSGGTEGGPLHGVDPNARLWGQLPPKLRSEILQSKTDGFPPGYEALLQSYYQQLAEEKSLDDKPASATSENAKPTGAKPGTP